MLINVVQVINKLNLNNPKGLFVISYKVAFRLTMESCVGVCENKPNIFLLEFIHCWGGGIRVRFDSKRGGGIIIFTYTNPCVCVQRLAHSGVFHSAIEESTRHIMWPLAYTDPSHARRGHTTRTETMRGTCWLVAAHDFGDWQS